MLKQTIIVLTALIPATAGAQSIDPVFISNVPQLVDSLPDPVELPGAAADLLGSSATSSMTFESHPDAQAAQRLLKLRSAAALVIDQEDGRLLYAKNTDAVMPIASITKLMTAIVVLDSGLPLDELITHRSGRCGYAERHSFAPAKWA